MKKFLPLLLLTPTLANAECTPTPDCASIGYTQTSCEGDYLACPFDSTKLKCLPCDSSFRYDCTGDNITAGIGNACDGKYVSCECSGGLTFNNGICICPNITSIECLVGTIYYPNGKCSNDYVSCLNPVGVVVKDNELVMSWISSSKMGWGGLGTDIEDLTNYGSAARAQADYAGVSNTAIIVASHTNLGETALNSAAIYCNEYAPIGQENTQSQWYLPSAGELFKYVHSNYEVLNNIYTNHLGYSDFAFTLWSSSEYFSQNAWFVSTQGSVSSHTKTINYYTTCFLAIN